MIMDIKHEWIVIEKLEKCFYQHVGSVAAIR